MNDVPPRATEAAEKPQLAVLFWCYKEPAICADRLRLIRRENRDIPIYVLFGGEPAHAHFFEEAFEGLVDDFYVFDDEPPVDAPEHFGNDFRDGVFWKYHWGDLMFLAWHRDRGKHLTFDTVVVVQWDMLVYGKIEEVFGCLQKDEVIFSGLRPIREVEEDWLWVSKKRPEAHQRYQTFLTHLRDRYNYTDEPICCVAIVIAFSRMFLDRFAEIERLELGFIEYRLPMYAQVFGVPIREDHPFRPWWGAIEKYSITSALRARPCEIWAPVIRRELSRIAGARVFHPYWRTAPVGYLGWLWALLDSGPRLLWQTLTKPHCRPWQRWG